MSEQEMPAVYEPLPTLPECLARSARLLRQAEQSIGMESSDRMIEASRAWVNIADTMCAMIINGVPISGDERGEE